jgi:hypothetical protein
MDDIPVPPIAGRIGVVGFGRIIDGAGEGIFGGIFGGIGREAIEDIAGVDIGMGIAFDTFFFFGCFFPQPIM